MTTIGGGGFEVGLEDLWEGSAREGNIGLRPKPNQCQKTFPIAPRFSMLFTYRF